MAISHIHPIKSTLNLAIDYIENPEKTEEHLLVSGFCVDPLTASIEFEMTASLARHTGGSGNKITNGSENLAYHMWQSFSPEDEVTPEQAHEIGKEWAYEVLGEKYEYVIATHVDKGHIHNHVIFNATSFYTLDKYDDAKNNYKDIRRANDIVCERHGLSVIKNPKEKGITHHEWTKKKIGSDNLQILKTLIDETIETSKDYRDFCSQLRDKGVEIQEGQYLKLRLADSDMKNFRVFKEHNVGPDYTREGIQSRIMGAERKAPLPEKKPRPRPKNDYASQIDFQARRTKIAATKELAAALLTIRREDINQYSDFELRYSEVSDKSQEVQETMKLLDEKNRSYKDVAKCLVTYNEILPIIEGAESQPTRNRQKYLNHYAQEIERFNFAVKRLEQHNVKLNVDPDKVTALVQEQDRKVSALNETFKEAQNRLVAIRQAQNVVDRVQMQTELESVKEAKRDDEKR